MCCVCNIICVPAKTSNALFPAGKERPIAGSGYVTCESKIHLKKIRGTMANNTSNINDSVAKTNIFKGK